MKYLTVKGSFNLHHCSNKHGKCHSRVMEPAVLFDGRPCWSRVAPVPTYTATLFDRRRCRIDVGPVDPHWFEKALNCEMGTKEVQCKECQENRTHQDKSPKVDQEINKTPARQHRLDNQYQAMTPQLFISTPSPLSPDEQLPGWQGKRSQSSEKHLSTSISQDVLRNDISPSTPRLVSPTSTLQRERCSPSSQSPAVFGINLCLDRQFYQEEPSPSRWHPTYKQATPNFMKQLFKTPSTMSKLDDYSFATPGQFLSTPLRMSVSLGADLDDSNLSWTSSLATPQGSNSKRTDVPAAPRADYHSQSTVINKALFTSPTDMPHQHTQRKQSDLGNQTSGQPLQSLHIPSTEDEEEQTLEAATGNIGDSLMRKERERVDENTSNEIQDEEEHHQSLCDVISEQDALDEQMIAGEMVREHGIRVVEEVQQYYVGSTQTHAANMIRAGDRGMDKEEMGEAKDDADMLSKDQHLSPTPQNALTEDGINDAIAFGAPVSLQKPKPACNKQRCSKMQTAIDREQLSKTNEQETEPAKTNMLEENGFPKETLSEIHLDHNSLCGKHNSLSIGGDLINLSSDESDENKIETSDRLCKEEESKQDKRLDTCKEGIHSTDVHSLTSPTQPSPSGAKVFQAVAHVSPTTSDRDVRNITPLEQAILSSNIESPDTLSQLSPHCVSESHLIQNVLPVPKDDMEWAHIHQIHSYDLSCDRLPLNNLLALPLKSVTQTSDPDFRAEIPDILTDSKSCCKQETKSQLFKIQPKAAATRKFFYPAAARMTPKTDNHKAMQWVAEAVLVKTDEKQQQQQHQSSQMTLPDPDPEKPENDASSNKAPHSPGSVKSLCSSTPAPRNSAFVTFSNFIKSKRTLTSETFTCDGLTSSHHINVRAHKEQLEPIELHQQATHSSRASANSRSKLDTSLNQSTPPSRRDNACYSGMRQRANTHGFPAPKRLKTVMDDEQHGIEHRLADEDYKEKVLECQTASNTGVLKNSRSTIENQAAKPSEDLDHKQGNNMKTISSMTTCKQCSTAEAKIANPSIANGDMTRQGQSLSGIIDKGHDEVIPVSVSFDSVSGKPIGISEFEVEKAERIWLKDQGINIPAAVSFSSASGKTIQISNSALDKAKAVFDEDDKKQARQAGASFVASVTNELGNKNNSQSFGGANTEPANHGIGNISTENEMQEVSASTLRSASTGNEITNTADVVDGPVNQPRDISKTGQVQSEVCSSTSDLSNCDLQKMEVSVLVECQQNQALSVSRFVSASGKAITISQDAQQRAEKVLKEGGNEILTTGFATAAGRIIKLSESDLRKARTLLDDSEETDFPGFGKVQSSLSSFKQGENSGRSNNPVMLHKQNRGPQLQPEPRTNGRNLSKGFRPFKAPAKINTPAGTKTLVKINTQMEHSEKLIKVGEEENEETLPFPIRPKQLEIIPETSILMFSPRRPKETVSEDLDFGEFLSASQAQREIEFAEETESAYAFIQAEDDSFSQFEELTVDKVNPSDSHVEPGHSIVSENAMKTNLNILEQGSLKLVAPIDVTDEKNPMSGKSVLLFNSETQDSFETLDAADKAFSNSQCTLINERKTGAIMPVDALMVENSHQPETHPDSSVVSADNADSGILRTILKSSQHIVDFPMVGFQTASGHKVTVSEEALQKVKMLVDTKVHAKSSMPQKPSRKSITPSNNFSHGIKEKSSADKVSPVLQTAGRSKEMITDGVLNCAQYLVPRNSVSSEQQLQNVCIDTSHTCVSNSQSDPRSEEAVESAWCQGKDVFGQFSVDQCTNQTPELAGFQTASGKMVFISEESLQQAKGFLCKEDDDAQKPRTKQKSALQDGFQLVNKEQLQFTEEYPAGAETFCDPQHGINMEIKEKSAPILSGFQIAGCRHVKPEGLLKKEEEIVSSLAPSESQLHFQSTKQNGGTPVGSQKGAVKDVTVSEVEGAVSLDGASDNHKTSSSKGAISGEQPTRVSYTSEKSDEKLIAPCSVAGSISVTGADATLPAGFLTATNSKVTMLQVSLQEAKNLLDNSTQAVGMASNSCTGFQMATGNKVAVSIEASTKARKFLADDCTLAAPEVTVQEQPFLGFSRASGSRVSVSQSALERVKRLFRDSDGSNASLMFDKTFYSPKHKKRRSDRVPDDAISLGFQTGNGSSVSVSQKSLQEAKSLLDDFAQCSNSASKTLDFQTASGNKVTASAECVAQTQTFFADNETITAPRSTGEGQPFLGFSTASGNKVSLSNAALEKARRIFEDPSDNSEVPTVFDKNASTSGRKRKRWDKESNAVVPRCFQTAINRSVVSISKSSTQNVEAIHGNEMLQRCQIGTPVPRVVSRESYPPALPWTTPHHSTQFNNLNMACTQDGRQTGESSDAVVPHLEGKANHASSPNSKTTAGVLKKSLCSHPGISVQPLDSSSTQSRSTDPFSRQRSCVPKYSPGTFQPPYQTMQHRTYQQNLMLDKLPDTSQIVPQLHTLQLPPKAVKTPSDNKKQGQVCLNNRTCSSDIVQSCPVPETARVEVGLDNSSVSCLNENSGSILSSKEQEVGLAVGRWEQARRNQIARIQNKKVQVIKPKPGELFTKRQRGIRVPLYKPVNGQPLQQYSRSELLDNGVLPSTLTVTASSAEDFKFTVMDHMSPKAMDLCGEVVLSDGGTLVPDDEGRAGKQEFLNALLDTPGVDPKFLTANWVNNHYRWIVWKLAAMEVAYPEHFAGRFLTPNQVMLQLKYRYDREIDNVERSALKKILEGDDTPSRRMIVCVAGIHLKELNTEAVSNQEGAVRRDDAKTGGPSGPVLELTDGWYSVKTVIDRPLAGLVRAGKIYVGQKLCIYGAELSGSQDACSPLEVPTSIRLRISANSTRCARYDARLGFQRCPHPFPVPLASLYPDGGTVGCVDVVVVRCYPIQFMEKHSEGGCTFRGRRAEEKEAARFAQEKQKEMERLYCKIQKEFQEEENKKVTSSRLSSVAQRLTAEEVAELQTGQEVYEALNNTMDPSAVQVLLSERQMMLLNEYQRSLHEKRQTDLQGQFKRAMEDEKQGEHIERKVTALVRIRVVDYLSKPGVNGQTHQLTVWKPSHDVTQLLSEGKRLRIFNCSTSSRRFCMGSSNVQLASVCGTRYQTMPFSPAQFPNGAVYHPREVLRLSDALHPSFSPAYGEVDMVAVVVTIQGAVNSLGKSSNQIVYLSDAQRNLIAVKFWGGLHTHCVESLVKPGALLASSNLQWRAKSGWSCIPCLHAGEGALVTQNPKAKHLQVALQDLHKQIRNPVAFVQSLEQLVMDKMLMQTAFPNPRTPVPESCPALLPSKVQSGHRSIGCITTRSAAPECSHLSGAEGSASCRRMSSGLPNANQQCSYSTPSDGGNQLISHGAFTSLDAVTSHTIDATPPNGKPTVPPSSYGPVSTPVSDPRDRKRLDASRRFDLLSRVPSPPALSPLPTSLPNRVTRSFRLPSSRRSIPQWGSHYRLSNHSTPGLKDLGSRVKHSNLYDQDQEVKEMSDKVGKSDSVKVSQTSENLQIGVFTTPVKHSEGWQVKDLDKPAIITGRPGMEISSDDMTASQQEVLESLGISCRSLGEIDWQWTQQADPCSPPKLATVPAKCYQPSPDFSYDTPSQSPTAEKDELPAACVASNSNMDSKTFNNYDNKYDEVKSDKNVFQASTIGKGGQNKVEKNKASINKKILGRRTCCREFRGKSALKNLNLFDSHDSSQKQQMIINNDKTAIYGGGCGLSTKHHVPKELVITGSKEDANMDGDGDKSQILNEETIKSTSLQQPTVNKAQNCLKDEVQVSEGKDIARHQPPQTETGKTREAWSKADLSILEQSTLLSSEWGKSTRRLTRSSRKRSTSEVNW